MTNQADTTRTDQKKLTELTKMSRDQLRWNRLKAERQLKPLGKSVAYARVKGNKLMIRAALGLKPSLSLSSVEQVVSGGKERPVTF